MADDARSGLIEKRGEGGFIVCASSPGYAYGNAGRGATDNAAENVTVPRQLPSTITRRRGIEALRQREEQGRTLPIQR